MPTSPSRRALLAGLAAAGAAALAGCGRPRGSATAAPPTAEPPAAAPLAPTAAPGAGAPGSPTPTPPAVPATPAQTERSPAEQVVREYFRLLAVRPLEARALLTPEWLARSGQAEALPAPQAVEVVSLQPLRQYEGRVEFGLELSATRQPGTPGPWSAGLNYRFALVIETPRGWRIAEIASAPISDAGALAITPTSGFTRQGGRQLGATFEIPTGWVRDGDEWVFRPAPGAPVAVGVVRASAPDPGALLPDRAEVLASEPIDVGWATGTRYTLRRGGARAREVHIVASLGGKATYDVFSTAPDEESSLRLADQARNRVVQTFALVGG
jgi:hypothetical protein